MVATVVMVAEKPSIAQTIAGILSYGKYSTSKGSSPVHEYDGQFNGQAARFKVTSVKGHVYSTDFPAEYQNWDRVDPADLFHAPIVKVESKGGMRRHLSSEGRGAHHLVLWLDCDREGENICYEVMDNVCPVMASKPSKPTGGKAGGQNVWRAKFSSLAPPDIQKAMNSLGSPNENESLSVDARQELDLKVGISFSRFQTRHFQGMFGDLDASVISYGPCQTPTLHFVVKRFDEIETFQEEPYWRLDVAAAIPSAQDPTKTLKLPLSWARKRCFDAGVANVLLNRVKSVGGLKMTSLTTKDESRKRPKALNTVTLLKAASIQLGLGPQQALSVAEHLYLSGYVSYPRTETCRYPPNFDLKGTIQEVARGSKGTFIGQIAQRLASDGYDKPRTDGEDAGDHPPITPVRGATPDELGFNEWRMYDLITSHFLASLAGDCKIRTTRVAFQADGEKFSGAARKVVSPGFTELFSRYGTSSTVNVEDDYYEEGDEDNYNEAEDEYGVSSFGGSANEEDIAQALQKLPAVSSTSTLSVHSVSLAQCRTRPPSLLTEAELLGLMERGGIGTDASMATHVNNVIERGYVQLNPQGRRLSPTKLGVALIHGYYQVDPELVLPSVRATIERQVSLIAQGKAKKEDVVRHSLAMFALKYKFFVSQIGRVDSLFETSFTSLASSGKPFSRCGHCRRYMVLIDKRPCRLHCKHCDKSYALPQGGSYKVREGDKCPLDDFDLVWYDLKGGRTAPLCPLCYNEPPFDKLGGLNALQDKSNAKAVSCFECAHPTCKFGINQVGVMPCPNASTTAAQTQRCTGTVCLESNSGPKWRLSCSVCRFELLFTPNAVKTLTVNHQHPPCEECGARLLDVNRNKTALVAAGKGDEDPLITGCIVCDPDVNAFVQAGEAKVFFRRATGGGGVAGRGRGGRRGGRGRGRY